MQWARNYFTYQMDRWVDMAKDPANSSLRLGHAAFGYRQAAMWKGMRENADQVFSAICDDYRVSLHSTDQTQFI